jgi:UDPglucose--hexose-1-phosphate uridylyltransferase
MTSSSFPQFSEARFDPITDKAVLIATKRRDRPTGPLICPGCFESQTPPAVCVYPEGAPLDAPGWKVRVVPNKFSCFSPAGSNLRYETAAGLNGIKDPAGSCEVLFETEHHKHPIHSRSVEEIVFCVRAMISRYESARSDPRAKFWYGFKNLGKAAGGTLDHEHWQLYTLPFVPPAIQDRYERAAQHFNRTGRSLYRDQYTAEAAAGERVVAQSAHFLTFVPFAAGMPFEIRIAPLRDSADFSSMSEEELTDFGRTLRDAVARLCTVHPDLAFNIELHTASFEHADSPWFCWHLSIIPRVTTPAGVELGLNVMVNPVAPEDAASRLRAASVG